MMITHEEARRLMQFKADNALKEPEDQLLEAHLKICAECQKYQAGLNELGSTLQTLMQRRWNQQPLPLSTSHAASRGYKNLSSNILFATRIVAMGLICIAFLFNVWQFTQAGGNDSNPPSADIPLIPTPSLQSTERMTSQGCEFIQYTVQRHDTLESIARQYSLSVEDLKAANHLAGGNVEPSMKLSLLLCNPTPSGTPKIVKTTFTPLLGSTTLTPAKSPTQ
jgi:hypothetical protein